MTFSIINNRNPFYNLKKFEKGIIENKYICDLKII